MVSASPKAAEVNVVQTWRQRAGWLLIAFMVLDVVSVVLNLVHVLSVVHAGTANASLTVGLPIGRELVWLALDSFLVWRIWRHGRVAWIILLVLRAVSLLAVVGATSLYLSVALAICGVQAVLLVSPAVRRQVRAQS